MPLTCKALIVGEIDRRLTVNPFTVLINLHLTISGLKKKSYTSHSFRHSFATRLTEKNVKSALDYMGDFFETIQDPGRADRAIVRACRPWL